MTNTRNDAAKRAIPLYVLGPRIPSPDVVRNARTTRALSWTGHVRGRALRPVSRNVRGIRQWVVTPFVRTFLGRFRGIRTIDGNHRVERTKRPKRRRFVASRTNNTRLLSVSGQQLWTTTKWIRHAKLVVDRSVRSDDCATRKTNRTNERVLLGNVPNEYTTGNANVDEKVKTAKTSPVTHRYAVRERSFVLHERTRFRKTTSPVIPRRARAAAVVKRSDGHAGDFRKDRKPIATLKTRYALSLRDEKIRI